MGGALHHEELQPAHALELAVNLPTGLVILDADGEVRFANPAALATAHAGPGEQRRAGAWRRVFDAVHGAVTAIPTAAVTLRLQIADLGTLRVEGRVDRHGQVVALVRREAARWDAACRELAASAGATGAETRLAVRVLEGRSLSDIAGSFAVPTGTIKSRLSSLYRKLGVRNRTGLLLAARAAAVDLTATPSPDALAPAVDLPLTMVHEAVVGLPLGLCAVHRSGELRWATPQARVVLGMSARARRSTVLRRAVELWLDLPEGPHRFRVPHQPAPVRVLLFPAGSVPLGAVVHTERPRAEDEDGFLRRRGLGQRQIEIVLRIAAGHTNAAIAGDLGVHVGTVARAVAAAFERLGVRSRAEVVALLESAAPLDDRNAR